MTPQMNQRISTSSDRHTTVCRLGTRGSRLALTQSAQVGRALEAAGGLRIDLVTVRTQGDVDRTSLRDLGGVGVFAAQLRHALLEQSVDLAVHSFKDLPTQGVPGLTVACTPAREDPRDALCARDGLTLASLPDGARVGTGSPRRAAQLLAVRPDLEIVDLRGNVPTRLARVRGLESVAHPTDTPTSHHAIADKPGAGETPVPPLDSSILNSATVPPLRGDLDAVVLALAGLRRLGLASHATDVLGSDVMLPAPAQGALAVETRADVSAQRPALATAMAHVDDRSTRLAVAAERALMRHLGAGCAAPVGALAESSNGHLVLDAVVASLNGTRLLRRTDRAALDGLDVEGADALGVAVACRLLTDGAEEIVDLHANKLRRP